ncbi:MAG: DUF7507 domain-containing protein, partial [Nitrososphaerales archaeon]
TFLYDYTKAGIHAYDFITTVDPKANGGLGDVQGTTGEALFAPGIEDLMRCQGLSGADATACTALVVGTPLLIPIPNDGFDSSDSAPGVGTGSTQTDKEDSFETSFGTRYLTLFSDSAITLDTGVSLVHDPVAADSDTADSTVKVSFKIDMPGCSSSNKCELLIFFGGHISKGGTDNTADSIWGIGQGASDISGGPYHTADPQVDGKGGSRDNQLKGADVLVPANPVVDLTKEVDDDKITTGDEVTYTFTAENTGDVDLTNCVINDPDLGGDIGSPFGMTVGSSPVVRFKAATLTDDLINVATITCNSSGADATDEATASVTVLHPDVTIDKTVRDDKITTGDEVTYDITVTNTGDTSLDCTTTDPDLGLNEFATIAAGDFVTYSPTIALTDDLINTATASCEYQEGTLDDVTDSAEVTVLHPDVTIDKTVRDDKITTGDEVTYDITVTNTGDTSLDCT